MITERDDQRGQDFWFKPKTRGYGASPANWKGWLATLAYVFGVLVFSLLWFGLNRRASTVSIGEWAVGLSGLVAASLVFLVVAKRKTQGEWRWR